MPPHYGWCYYYYGLSSVMAGENEMVGFGFPHLTKIEEKVQNLYSEACMLAVHSTQIYASASTFHVFVLLTPSPNTSYSCIISRAPPLQCFFYLTIISCATWQRQLVLLFLIKLFMCFLMQIYNENKVIKRSYV